MKYDTSIAVVTGTLLSDAKVYSREDGYRIICTIGVNHGNERSSVVVDIAARKDPSKMAGYLKKGAEILVNGRLTTQEFKTSGGSKVLRPVIKTSVGSMNIIRFPRREEKVDDITIDDIPDEPTTEEAKPEKEMGEVELF